MDLTIGELVFWAISLWFISQVLLGLYDAWHVVSVKERVEELNRISNLIHQVTVGYFLKYIPKNSKVVTFETLPEEFFDYSKVKHVDQHSIQTKKQYVKNLEFVEQEIQYMLNVYENEWKLKLGDSIFK